MKKVFVLLAVALFLMVIIVGPAFVVNAEGDTEVYGPQEVLTEDVATQPPETPQEQDFYDWSYLGTIAGATAAVWLIVQYTKKGIDKIAHFPTRLYVYILALLILLAARVFGPGISWADVPLVVLNSIMVATAAMGSYELTFAKRDGQ